MWISKNFFKIFKPILKPYLQWTWNNNWPRATIFFTTETGKNKKDVKTIFNYVSKTLDEKIKQKALELTQHCNTDDEKAIICFKWVRDNIRYATDLNKHFKVEFWQSPDETWTRRTGDCEDGSILLIKLMEHAGIPAFRRKLVTGYIHHKGKDIGHAYVIYLRECHNEWYCLDWCFYSIYCIKSWNANLKHRGTPLTYAMYGDCWWTTNENNSWIQHKFTLNPNSKIYDYTNE